MTPKLVCHRGASLWAPENTFAAADLALDMGGHVIELDVRECADGVLYVLHDRAVDRTTDGTGLIEHMRAAQVDALDAGRWFAPEFEGQRIPRFDAYMNHLRARGAGAYVEIKWCTPDTAAAILRETGMTEHAFCFSFKPEMRAGMRAAAPELRQMITLSIARNMGVARALHGADMIELAEDELCPPVVEAARAAGLDVMGYSESDDRTVFHKMCGLGVDYINHDQLDVSLSVLEEQT